MNVGVLVICHVMNLFRSLSQMKTRQYPTLLNLYLAMVLYKNVMITVLVTHLQAGFVKIYPQEQQQFVFLAPRPKTVHLLTQNLDMIEKSSMTLPIY